MEPAPAARPLEALPVDRLLGPIRSDPNPGLRRRSTHVVYDLVWLAAAVLGSPWLAYRSLRQRAFARMCLERLGRGLAPAPALEGGPPRVLVHGVSVGEVKAAQPVIRGLAERWPGLEIVVSTTTETGLQVARDVFGDLAVVRFPIDVTPVVRRFLERVRPTFVVLVELEIWPNFLREANLRGVPVAVVNGRITDKSFSQYRVFRWLLPQFNRISLFCVQAQEYAERFVDLYVEPERIVVTGNVKVDGLAVGPVDPGDELRRLLAGGPGQRVLVAGSTHEPEERLVLDAWRRGAPRTRLVLVPRHPQRAADLERELEALGARPQRLTRLRAGLEEPDPVRPALVDTIGELERVYGLADYVFVGGSLIPHGGQNLLEPVAQGRPCLYGPSMDNFAQEARLIEQAGAARRVADVDELARALAELVADPALAERMGAAGLRAVEAQKGATALTLAALERVGIGTRSPGGLSGA